MHQTATPNRLGDLVDLSRVQEMTEALYRAARVPIGIIDAIDGKVLVGAGWQDICVKFHRANPESRQRCIESDLAISQRTRGGERYGCRCANGMWDIGIPILVHQRVLATLFLGQFFYEGEVPDRAFFIEQARRYGFDRVDYLAALDRVPLLARSRVDEILEYNTHLARFLAEMAEHTLLLRHRLDERIESESALLEVQQISRTAGFDWNLETDALLPSAQLFKLVEREEGSIANTFTSFLSLIHEDDRAFVNQRARAIIDGRTPEADIEMRLRMPDGRVKWAATSGRVITDPATGKPLRMIGFVQDITSRKQAELERSNHEKHTLYARKLESLGMLAGGIAHDFNNILMTIMGNTELALLKIPPSMPERDLLQRVLQAGRRAADLANQMLAYSGRGKFANRPIELSSLVRDMGQFLPGALAAKTRLIYELTVDLPTFRGDPAQIRQVVNNLVVNAAEAIGNQAGEVTVCTFTRECDHAFLEATERYFRPTPGTTLPAGTYACLSVRDNGCGMTAETYERLFDPFYTTKFTGRGLGLPTVMGIVRGHKGTIKVDSTVGKGTTFTVLFPLDHTSAERAEVSPPVKMTCWRGHGTILVVDDEEAVLRVTTKFLTMFGFEVLTAEDGDAAIEIFRRETRKIVAVILDFTMPRVTGDVAFRQMRGLRKDLPVIVSSGYGQRELIQAFAGENPPVFLQKPFEINELRATLQRLLPGS